MTDATPTDHEIAQQLAQCRARGETYTPPSELLGAFDLQRGYELQRAYVTHWQSLDDIGGFKAAVTAPPMQQAFGLPGPVTSVLFAKGVRENESTCSAGDYRTLLVETELSFRLNQPLSTPVDSIDSLRDLIGRCSPAFELADPGFGKARFTGEDLVATNIACGGWIEGNAIDWAHQDLNAIQVQLTLDGSALHNEAAGSVMDGQLPALQWLINQTIAQGYTITPDHLLLTGAIGAAHPGQSGHYEADYGEAGRIAFELAD